ncbi:MAG: hypothetical protein KDA81_10075 [Planctomycetaceae bacterium]|nr:hypothetical protein [Planctomycetaceae bacterium]
MLKNFWQQEDGVILSAEIVLLGTILVLGMIVGLVELQCAVVAELSDLGDAIGNLDQSYQTPGMTAYKTNGIKSRTAGAFYNDAPDAGDCNLIITCDQANSVGEKSYFGGGYGGGYGGGAVGYGGGGAGSVSGAAGAGYAAGGSGAAFGAGDAGAISGADGSGYSTEAGAGSGTILREGAVQERVYEGAVPPAANGSQTVTPCPPGNQIPQ